MLRLLGQGKHMAEFKLTEGAVLKQAVMQFEKLASWYSAVSKYPSVFMEHLYYTYKINAQGHLSRHHV